MFNLTWPSFTIAIGKGKLSKVVFASHPKDLELILSNDDGELFDAPSQLNATLEPLLGTESLIGLSDNRHRRAGQLLLPHSMESGCALMDS